MDKKVIDKKVVGKEAKGILDKFAKALERVDSKDSDSWFVDRDEFEREEGKGEKCWEFKEKFLGNAPRVDGDFVVAEKGGWK
ncbi:hypothetical protein CMI38_05185 [Candidatus Pacearchaeota archaeon]|jgi:predicted Asp-tRNA(Asn)/Glu-tRNA(Gln) amidotransferase subunit C|nr:hypothetical protein [Candidatus Pacearchaeota archaeon]|tara:strand:+ start:7600 stop:7845 length:246 start_codon:yes stop_codon:yes gene_type:complete